MVILKVLKMVFLLVFLGWLLIWIMLPTKTYKYKWTSNLKVKLHSTYFKGQGINLLLLTFPIMFIAAFGCVYLHLQKKSEKPYTKSASKTGRLAFLRRPVLVMPTLGIVTLTELAFVAMFIALLIWSLANYIYVSYTGHLHMDKGVEVWHAKFRSVSLRLGYIGNICWAFLFFPVTRGSSILPLVGLTSESSIKYHIWLGHISNLLFLLHTIGFIIYWGITHQMSQMLEWSSSWVSNVAGEIAMVFAVAMWITSFRPIRKKRFEVFFYTHQLYAIYIIFYVLHVGAAYFCMIIPGIFLFVIDRHLRFLQSRQRARLLAARLLPSGTIELNFAKSPEVKYNPTSVMFINIPSISKLQWHPFTVTSSSNMEPDQLSVAIKCQGSWSHRLFQSLSSSSSSSLERLEVSVEGPYGPASSQFLRHETLVMLSGGSGIAPFISIIREIIHEANLQQPDTTASSKFPRMLLVCAFKTSADLAILDLLLPLSLPPTFHLPPQLHLQIEAYVTQDHGLQLDPSHKLIQTAWFKPDPLDSPITPILGSNSWLWLGAIIASSFAMFLLLLGIVTRYYIHPIEHGKDGPYHFSYWTLWEMFLTCACVFVATSGIFLWRKKGGAVEGWQVKSMEIPTPTVSPGSWFSNVEERGAESIPHQSLVEATNVHYGARPDLRI
ncbi:ferric reduction oxidase 4 isoform X2 [Syzygium oleosum]|uniref:ferric reduction oxidase 4 isoform X2 n=1 Tax=Syzygium oleosum TaxID=219896 RepID=UPI0024B9A74A|nr:ferric reduction oxidase 4 isoform X2 [Syzygium oleosum]